MNHNTMIHIMRVYYIFQIHHNNNTNDNLLQVEKEGPVDGPQPLTTNLCPPSKNAHSKNIHTSRKWHTIFAVRHLFTNSLTKLLLIIFIFCIYLSPNPTFY
jgi:hypothetical protein